MKSLLVGLVASLATPASSTFVVQCYSRLFDQRLDPIVTPGKASGHVHLIVGGSGFNATMDFNSARASSCSTCNVREDLSNYWTPKLYFKAQNGSILTVPVIGDNQGGNMGGMAIYYLTRSGPDNDKLWAFPPGFRMLAGDPSKRQETDDFAGRAISYKCVGGEAPNAADIKGLPSMKCDQIRAQVTFPSCWDGKNLDSNDHKSHVVYPKDGNYDGGRCPSTHPIHFPTLFSEVYYDTKAFQSMWYGTKQPFVLANGDDTGYGYHGDFVNGWDEAVLQKAVTDCIDGTADCPGKTFTFREQGETQACKLAPMINEQVNGVLSALPGCNPVGSPPPATCNAPGLSPPTPESLGYVDLTTSKGFKYIGCGKDNAGKRTLTVAQTSGSTMTVETCVDFCKSKNTQYAGLVYGGECYCGNDVAADRAPVKGQLGNCLMKCTGNQNEVCGGPDAISLYQSCNGGTCTNLAKRESRRLAILESVNANAMAKQ